jgi:alkylmercury lyase
VTGARIALEVGPQGAVSDGTPPPVSFIMPDPRKAAADIVRSFCHFVFFLASDAAAREWSAAHPGTVIATLEEAWELGRRRNARCYPGREFGFARASAQATLRSTTAASRPA